MTSTTAAGTGSTTDGSVVDVEDVLAQLTLEEKAALLDGSDFWHTEPVERLGVPALMVTDGPHGLRKQPEGGDHLGLTGSVPATCFPPAAGLASTWDVDLLRARRRRAGPRDPRREASRPARPRRQHEAVPAVRAQLRVLLRGPGARRRPRRGDGRGVQSQGVGTSLKHFAANNQETQRMTRLRRRRRAHAARDLPHRLRARRPRRTPVDGHVLLQPDQRRRTPAEDPWLLTQRPARGVGFRRARRLRLGRGRRPRRRRRRGPRPGDAVLLRRGSREASSPPCARAGSPTTTSTAPPCASWNSSTRSQPGLADPGSFDVAAHHALAREAALRSAVLLKNDPVASSGATRSCRWPPPAGSSPSSASSPAPRATRAPAAPR